MTPTIAQAGRQDTETVTRTIAEAFADDPVMLWTFGRADLFQKVFAALMAGIYLPRGFVTYSDRDAASMWLTPGGSNDLPVLSLLKLLAGTVPSAGLRPVVRGLQASEHLARLKPAQPFLYLFAIGVAPHAQGKGLGSLLIKDGLRHADTEQVPAYLESSKKQNIPLYERHGFEVVQETRIAKTSPPLWSMIREPRG